MLAGRTASGVELELLPAMANRHGLITGATGTGKTVTLQVLAERFSALGVPVVMADVKGDLSGIAAAGAESARMTERLAATGFAKPEWRGAPVEFWDVFGQTGHAVRATVSDMGPLLLSRLLGLNETQSGVLALVFKIADDAGLLLLDLKDLRAMLTFVGENAAQFKTTYGNVSAASVGAIQRGLLAIEEQGGDQFFGEPMLDIDDLIQTAPDGRGVINILAAERLLQSPKVYATFLLWMMSELFERLPEVGDQAKPKIVFVFDEAHLLFDDAPEALVEKIEQVVRLIRSKGVGVYFITQNPLDIPESVLGQLGNRVHHAMRAFTSRDQKAVKTLASTLRQNPDVDTATAIGELKTGEALVSFLDPSGAPSPVMRAWIAPPASRIGPLTADERARIIGASVLKSHYGPSVERESAYEKLQARAAAQTANQSAAPVPTSGPSASGGAAKGPMSGTLNDLLFGSTGPRGGKREGMIESAAKSAARSIGSGLGRQILRGILGGIFVQKAANARRS